LGGQWLEVAIEKPLEQNGRGERIQSLLLFLSGETIAGPLAFNELLLGGEGGKPLINQEGGFTRGLLEIARESDGSGGGRAMGAVHIQRKANENLPDILGFDNLEDLRNCLGWRADLQGMVWGRQFPAGVTERQADTPRAEINRQSAHGWQILFSGMGYWVV
jgi:hypothetical protein